jgi:hypothetical protein
MSASIATAVVQPMPVELPRVQLEKPARDATTRAVLRYFEAERKAATGTSAEGREHANALDHLVRICYGWTLAMRNKKTGAFEGRYFLRDRYGSLKVEETPQFSNKDGRRTGYNVREEGTTNAATIAWVQEWLLRFLARYHGKSSQEINAVADTGKFRYLGLWCRVALKNLVYRQQKREKKDRLTGFSTASESVGTSELGAGSSLRTHVPFEQVLEGVNNARLVVMANADELERLGLLTGLLAYLGEAEHVMEPHFQGRVTRAIMELRGVSESAAGNYKREFSQTIKRELEARNPLLHSIINELTHEPLSFVVSTASAENEDNRRLLRESRQVMAAYKNDCRLQGLGKSAGEAGIEQRRLRGEEERALEEEFVQSADKS